MIRLILLVLLLCSATAQAANPSPKDAPTVVKTDQGNTYTTGAQDFGSVTSVKMRVAAGCTAATNGFICYDSTNNMWHLAASSADAMVPVFTITPVNDECVKWVVSGSNYKLGSAGAACGTSTGAPTDATYITQTANGTLSNEQALSALGTGLMKNTTGSGVISIAAAGSDYSSPSSTESPTNKTLDCAATGNVCKQKGLIYLTHPHLVDGTGATLGTTATALAYGHATFSNSADQAANYVEYRIIVPTDIDTAVALRAKLKFSLGNTDTGTHRYVLSMASQADSASATGTPGTAINLDFSGDASGASGDVETVGYTTLTGWAAALTADHLWVIRLARDGDAAQDTSTVNSTELGLVIEYGVTQ